MISVFRGQFHYKFNGEYGVLVNMDNGAGFILGQEDTKACNRSNKELDVVIEKCKEYLV